MPSLRITRASATLAGKQASWIVTVDPWRALGYEAGPLRRWLTRHARDGNVLAAMRDGSTALGIIVVTPNVLLGDFIALLAVRPEVVAEGVGRALVAHTEARTFRRRRWLYVSSDAANAGAARFYRKLQFVRVGRLPDLIRAGHTEILWRKGRAGQAGYGGEPS